MPHSKWRNSRILFLFGILEFLLFCSYFTRHSFFINALSYLVSCLPFFLSDSLDHCYHLGLWYECYTMTVLVSLMSDCLLVIGRLVSKYGLLCCQYAEHTYTSLSFLNQWVQVNEWMNECLSLYLSESKIMDKIELLETQSK